jgi:hypothetical protein
LLQRASENPAIKQAFVEPEESEEESEDVESEEEESVDEDEAIAQQAAKRVKVERRKITPPKQANRFSYGVIYEFPRPEVNTHYVFIPRCPGLAVKVRRPEGTTNIIVLDLSFKFPLDLLNELSYETGHSIAYIEAHCPLRTFPTTIKVPFPIDKFEARVIKNMNCIVVKIKGQENLVEITIDN